ncbi:MAG TPA: hypothetical protein VKZ50_05070 [bacterium]|nr:hypothetical protein [bacterium]
MATTEQIAEYVVNELTERGVRPVKTALVKFIYLSDVESVRAGLPRITNVEWIFYKYGPYSFELDHAISRIAGQSIDELSGVSATGKTFFTYHGPGHGAEYSLAPQQRGIIKDVLDRWAGESLASILNYVYFETEPMLDAVWERPLDFGLIHPRVQVTSLANLLLGRIDPRRIEELTRLKQEFWSQIRSDQQKLVEPSPEPRYDDVLAQGLRAIGSK